MKVCGSAASSSGLREVYSAADPAVIHDITEAAESESSLWHALKADWIFNCLMLRIASPQAYKLLSDMKMLPLPSMSRLTQILRYTMQIRL
ncbi:hypothetical protein HPB51_022358 [Rhipicephalus microplus]|uniref:Uncharacterized protein n=1 Tax=Rhipicephalus microplus TaxID=6941 RepID=A0A9J6EV65_RHIMP|nr:hypothetical protein HPB51_022358 [Rhipicephalus microplus]